MATERNPKSGQEVPDTATCYGREKPEAECGMGRLDNNKAVPTRRRDKMLEAVNNRHPLRQLNSEDEPVCRKDLDRLMSAPEPVDHSMKEEEPLGWDQAPMDIHRKRDQRHPRTGGKGGTPDANEPRDAG